ncbi:hypothetical protein OG874_35380 [Nocardia sp. NBC_00565]|uniref:hypothetical protein n=1 Tax=Nocardia sp. NBC_00565 TaxID=2975993 RepID=UPI002E80597E|nr:hypothetical protein [Nocardia sp. NBC_00565]WUC01977.1 hypothetical protein OG874_35380 [Nocardia sp. NBC_00565]
MFSKTSSSFRRGFARVAIAGALAAVPLSALAVTASAAAPDSSVPTVQAASDQIPLQGTDIDGPHRGDDWDGQHHHRGDHRGPGDQPGDQQNGPWQPPFPPQGLPSTGSAG